MASNLLNQTRNVLSKRLLGGEQVIYPSSSPNSPDQHNSQYSPPRVLISYTNSVLVMTMQEESMDDINLFSLITVLSFLLSCPLMLLVEGVKFSPAYLHSTVSHCLQKIHEILSISVQK
jgi:hypothetical protein